MILQREFYGQLYRLVVIKEKDVFKFKLGDQVFPSLTAAAKHVCRDDTRTISGPLFWRVPILKP